MATADFSRVSVARIKFIDAKAAPDSERLLTSLPHRLQFTIAREKDTKRSVCDLDYIKREESQSWPVALLEFFVTFMMANLAANHFAGGLPPTGPLNEALFKELWHACAGPLVSVPREDERVYYFPQGHMEQLKASTHQGLDQQLPSFNLPSKILSKVMNVQLRAEPDTDEVYAQITLLPEHDVNTVA
ncbi:hypothetical protein SASPL_115652 [Salvia splendens]|uniref:Auxin response factor n=1 Tax=Salvia splendens TaxID=180675 RepID=A0A8X8Y803_SALSN|nr:hypothetical protein SASPL_115652 [Salvia splendens]